MLLSRVAPRRAHVANGELILSPIRIASAVEPRSDRGRIDLVERALTMRRPSVIRCRPRSPRYMPKRGRGRHGLGPDCPLYDILVRADPAPVVELNRRRGDRDARRAALAGLTIIARSCARRSRRLPARALRARGLVSAVTGWMRRAI